MKLRTKQWKLLKRGHKKIVKLLKKGHEKIVKLLRRAREDREAQNQAMEAQNKAMEAIAEKVGAAQDINPSRVSGGDSKSRAKGRHLDKLERDIDYATFL